MTYPFFPVPPGSPTGGGGGSFSSAAEGEAEAEAEAGGAGTGDAGASDAGAAAGADDESGGPDNGDVESSSEGAEGDFVTETDGVTTESLGTGSGSPGSGGSASEGYYADGTPIAKEYSKTFYLTNVGGGNARIRSINFNTPEGIQHVADLTDLGSVINFTDPLFTTSTVITTGTSKTFIVGYNYQYGGQGTRTGSVIVRGTGGLELRANITLIISQTGSTAGGSAVVSGGGTGGGGTGGGYVPPAEGSAGSGGTVFGGGLSSQLPDQEPMDNIYFIIG